MPIRDFLLNTTTGKLAVVNGDFATVGGASDAENLAAVGQAIKVRVRMFLGEVWLDESIGVDWLGQILVKNPNPVVVRELIRRAIAETPDVLSVTAANLELDASTRAGSITYRVATTFGTATGEVTV